MNSEQLPLDLPMSATYPRPVQWAGKAHQKRNERLSVVDVELGVSYSSDRLCGGHDR